MSKGGAKGYAYFSSFAVAFGEGPATVGRIWADEKLIYKGGAVFGIYFMNWSAVQPYAAGDLVMYPADVPGNPGTMWQAKIPNTGKVPPNALYWTETSSYPVYEDDVQYVPGSLVRDQQGTIYAAIAPNKGGHHPLDFPNEWVRLDSYYKAPTIYPGTEDQNPDPLIEAASAQDQGNPTSAYRGLCYAVWENFPLANFGNRLPNIRAELNGVVASTPPSEIQQQIARYSLQAWELEGLFSGKDITLGASIAGEYIFVAYRTRRDGSGTPTIFDDDGHTWTPIYAAEGVGFWYTQSHGFDAGNVIHFTNRSYDQEARVVVLPDVGDPPTFATAHNESSTPLSISLEAVTLTRNLFLLSPQFWQAVMIEMGGTFLAFINANLGFEEGTLDPDFSLVFPQASLPEGRPNLEAIMPTEDLEPVEGPPPGTITLAQVIQKICKRAGVPLANVDVTLVDADIKPNAEFHGYLLSNPAPAVDYLRHLLGAYFIDACESDGKLKFVPRSSSQVAVTIPEDDLGLVADNAKVTENIADALDPPRTVTVLHNDPAMDYQQGKQPATRTTRIVRSQEQENITLNLTLTADEARRAAEVALYLAWLERGSNFTWNVWRASYMRLDPTDIVSFIYGGVTFNVRLVRNSLGQGFVTELEGLKAEPATLELSPP